MPMIQSHEPIRVLLIEDDENLYKLYLAWTSYAPLKRITLEWAPTYAVGKTLLDEAKFDAILLDMVLPNGRGRMLVDGIQESHPDVPMVVLTGYNDEYMKDALQAGAQDYLRKDQLTASLMFSALRKAIIRHEVRRQFAPIEQIAREGVRKVEELRKLANRD